MKSKKNRYDSTSRKMKTAGLSGGITPILRKKDWKLTPIDQTSGSDKGKMTKRVDEDTIISMAEDRAGGATYTQLAEKYALSETFVRDAMTRIFVNGKRGKEVLKGILLENAIASGMQARMKIKDMSGMQATVATGIMTSKFIELDKHTQANPGEIDYSQLDKVANDLEELEKHLGGATDGVIDVDATVLED